MSFLAGIVPAVQGLAGALGQSISSSAKSALNQPSYNDLQQVSASNTAQSFGEAMRNREWQATQNKIAMDFNAAEAAKNREWQASQSNTAHQREVADLRAAGLNPVLSAGGGQGASTTSGATASGVTSAGNVGQVDTSTSNAMVSMMSSMLNRQTQLEAMRLSAATNQAIADKNIASAQLIANITGQYGLQRETLSGANQLRNTALQGDNALRNIALSGQYDLAGRRISADATLGAANISAAASRANTATSAASQERIQAAREAQETYIKANYPSTEIGAIASIINALTGNDMTQAAIASLFGGNVQGSGAQVRAQETQQKAALQKKQSAYAANRK